MGFFVGSYVKKKEFGFRVAFYSLISKVMDHVMPDSTLAYRVAEKKNKTILDVLFQKYHYIIDMFHQKGFPLPAQSRKIWIFWWQGLEKAPFIVKKCVQSIQKMYPDYEIVIISESNITDYIHLEPHIMEKVYNGIITYTHLSDIIRMKLMRQYGGAWMDATIFLTEPVDLENSFVTLHLNEEDNRKMVSKGKWCGFFMGGNENIVSHYVDEFFTEYWKKENEMIDYFLIDYILELGYENIQEIKNCIDGVPINNTQVFILQKNMNNLFDEELYSKICKDTCVHKLSYKEELSAYNNGKLTFYGKLMKEDV